MSLLMHLCGNMRNTFLTSSAITLLLGILYSTNSCTQKPTVAEASIQSGEAVVAFYNVENLFDTSDDPKTMDEDFTPGGKLAWDDNRYQLKLKRIAEVIDTLPGKLPVFVGLCEIENKKVLSDLVKQNLIASADYGIIHQDSEDERGIDVAALYDPKRMNVVGSNYVHVELPSSEDPHTRDILHVHSLLDGEAIHFFINHWPSRGGGQIETEPLREYVAGVLRREIDLLREKDPNVKVVVMGDFNDHPTDKSIKEVLGAGNNKGSNLYNFMTDDHLSGKGSYFYKGEWGALDQFIVTPALSNAATGWLASEDNVGIFYDDFLLFKDKEGVARPDRTYIGDRYNAKGHSDHLPVWMRLTRK